LSVKIALSPLPAHMFLTNVVQWLDSNQASETGWGKKGVRISCMEEKAIAEGRMFQ